MTTENGPVGFIRQVLSDKLVHSEGSTPNPPNGTILHLWDGGFDRPWAKFQFIPAPGKGHFGYIRHVSSGKYVHPQSGTNDPGKETKIVLWEGTHIGCLWAFDEMTNTIKHRRGLNIHTNWGQNMPNNGAHLMTWPGTNDGTEFIFCNEKGEKISPYPDPNLSGDWKLVYCIDEPKAEHTYEVKHCVGKSRSITSTEQHSWNVSAGVSCKWFNASAEYGGFVEKATSETWSEQTTKTHSVTVSPGPTVAVWQYVFSASQYDDQIDFESNILGDTNSVHEKPILD